MINSIQYTQDTQEDLYNLLKILKLPVRILNNNMNYWFVRTESGKYYKDFFFIVILLLVGTILIFYPKITMTKKQ